MLDRYDGPSIKDGTRIARAKKKKEGKMKYKVRAVPKVVSPDLNLPQGDEFMSFLSINENKIGLQRLLGNALIHNAPPDKIILVSGAFEDPMDVCCSSPTLNLEKVKSNQNEADTRMVLSIAHSQAEHIIVESQDTDVFIVLITNYKYFRGKKCTRNRI